MISVIVPVLNESATIQSVVTLAFANPQVNEVIVVDDGSIDGTPDKARAVGAMVITSTMLGKGASMEDGLRAARNELLVYLDGDLTSFSPDLIERLTEPIVTGKADFVKARFSRQSGRVTTLTAKPFLRLFFPELAHFEQPLGGIIAARSSLLRKLRFENDYGVDIGLLLDAAASGARLAEVNVGHIDHDRQSLGSLGNMAVQVLRTLVDRAASHQRLRLSQVRAAEEFERSQHADLEFILRTVGSARKLALFDLDGTLLRGRFIVEMARRTNRLSALASFLDKCDLDAEERTRKIAAIFSGVARSVFDDVARQMPLMSGAVEAIVALRRAGFRVGIVTDGFRTAAEIVRRRVFADFCVAHVLKFRQEKSTGEVVLSPAFVHPRGCTTHSLCKVNVMHHLLDYLGLQSEQVLAVGDGDNDRCLLAAAGHSFAFRPKSALLRANADHVVMGSLIDVARLALDNRPRASA